MDMLFIDEREPRLQRRTFMRPTRLDKYPARASR
jgi:hypothetical protein